MPAIAVATAPPVGPAMPSPIPPPVPQPQEDWPRNGQERPSRNDAVTIRQVPCPSCGRGFHPVGRQRFCSAACRQAEWRRRHSAAVSSPVPLPPHTPRLPRGATVYECPACGARLLGEQRCPECNVFCRRVGPGGACPHCDEPVAIADLIPHEGG